MGRFDGRIGEGSRFLADFFLAGVAFIFLKKFQIEVICVYLRKISEYEED